MASSGLRTVVPDAYKESVFQQLAKAKAEVDAVKRKREPSRDGGLELAVKNPRVRDPDEAEGSLMRRPDLQKRLVGWEGKKSHTAGTDFDPIATEEHLKKRGVLRDTWIVHELRAGVDPFYALWYCPRAVVKTIDPVTSDPK